MEEKSDMEAEEKGGVGFSSPNTVWHRNQNMKYGWRILREDEEEIEWGR